MPPRYAYWTIIVDDQPTAFRAGAQEDLMPTFNRLKEKHPSAKMMWFQNGKLWNSRLDAQEAMRARGELGRRGDERQGGFRGREQRSNVGPPFMGGRPVRRSLGEGGGERKDRGERPAWVPKSESKPKSNPSERPEWKPKGSFQDREKEPAWRPKGSSPDRGRARDSRPDWKPRGDSARPKPDWKPSSTRERFRDSKPSARSGQSKTTWKPKSESKLEWTPRTSSPQDPKPSEKRKWVPKEEYKKSLGIEAKKDKNWRPGGEHKDPRQKYKDAKKAKWTRFKKAIRTRSDRKKS